MQHAAVVADDESTAANEGGQRLRRLARRGQYSLRPPIEFGDTHCELPFVGVDAAQHQRCERILARASGPTSAKTLGAPSAARG